MSKVMKPRTTIPGGYYNLHTSSSSQSSIAKHHVFNRSISMSESEINNIQGLSDSEEEKSEIIEELLHDEEDDREEELIHSDFDDDDEEEEDRNDPFQRQMGYPPLPRYRTPMPPNPLDKLGTLTPMEEITEPTSSRDNTPASLLHKSKSTNNMAKKGTRTPGPDMSRSTSRASMNNLLVNDAGRSRSQSRTSSRNNLEVIDDHLSRPSSRNSPHLLAVEGKSRSRSQSRAGPRPLSPSAASRMDDTMMSDYHKPTSRMDDDMYSEYVKSASRLEVESLEYQNSNSRLDDSMYLDYPKSGSRLDDSMFLDQPNKSKNGMDRDIMDESMFSEFPNSGSRMDDSMLAAYPKMPTRKNEMMYSEYQQSGSKMDDGLLSDYPKTSSRRDDAMFSDYSKPGSKTDGGMLSGYPLSNASTRMDESMLFDYPKSPSRRDNPHSSEYPKSPSRKEKLSSSEYPKTPSRKDKLNSSEYPKSPSRKDKLSSSEYPKSPSRKDKLNSLDYPVGTTTSRPPSPPAANDQNHIRIAESSLGALDTTLPPMENDETFREHMSTPESPVPQKRSKSQSQNSSANGKNGVTKKSNAGTPPKTPKNMVTLAPATGSGHSSGADSAAPAKRARSRHPSRAPTPRPLLEEEQELQTGSVMGGPDALAVGNDTFADNDLRSILDKDYDSDEMDKIISYDRVRSWQRGSTGSGSPIYSAMADAEFASALDGMITKLHGAKVDWEYRVKLADDLTAALKNVSPQVLLKNLSQIIPLVSNIAAESHFRVSLSILATITTLGDRLRDCKAFLGPKSIQNADLTWLIRRLCTVCGESRSTLRSEGALALSHLIKGAGPELVCDPLFLILSSASKTNNPAVLTAGPRIKAAAIDALTFALLTFPRDEFDLPVLAKHVCKSLWNSKRRVRQAALECLAVVAHALGPSVALPIFRQYIEDTKRDLTSSSSSGGTRRNGMNYGSVATPTAAVSARVSRHLLPSPSPAGLVEYAVMIPQRGLKHSSYENLKTSKNGGLEPVLNGNGSGKNRHSGGATMIAGADIAWILAGTGPTVSSTLYSPRSNLDW